MIKVNRSIFYTAVYSAAGRIIQMVIERIRVNNVPNDYVWGIFVADASIDFPNFFPIGIYTTRELAINEVEALPRDHNYQFLRLPLNNKFAYYHKKSYKLVGMDAIHHEHFHFKDES